MLSGLRFSRDTEAEPGLVLVAQTRTNGSEHPSQSFVKSRNEKAATAASRVVEGSPTGRPFHAKRCLRIKRRLDKQASERASQGALKFAKGLNSLRYAADEPKAYPSHPISNPRFSSRT